MIFTYFDDSGEHSAFNIPSEQSSVCAETKAVLSLKNTIESSVTPGSYVLRIKHPVFAGLTIEADREAIHVYALEADMNGHKKPVCGYCAVHCCAGQGAGEAVTSPKIVGVIEFLHVKSSEKVSI